MSNAWWAYGSEFQIGTTKVAMIRDINGPNMGKDAIEITHNDGSDGDGYRQFIPGWRDGGEVSIMANWLPKAATHYNSTGLLAKFEQDTVQAFKIVTSSDGSSGTIDIGFNGIVTSFNADLPIEEQGKLECTIKISGAVTFT